MWPKNCNKLAKGSGDTPEAGPDPIPQILDGPLYPGCCTSKEVVFEFSKRDSTSATGYFEADRSEE